MSKPHCDKGFEAIYQLFERYFVLLKAMRDLANKIPELESKEEKIKAYKEYFKKLERLKELKVEVEDHIRVLSWL